MIRRKADNHERWIMLSAGLALLGGPALGQAEATAPENTLPPGVVAVEPSELAAPTYAPEELADLVGPIALYPDDLVAIVLPASTYPLQIVQAARFLKNLEDDPSLEPDPEWDEAIVALLNYPQVLALLNDDLDWTWRLGDAVLAQQADVIEAIEQFRDRVWLAGNLRSDDKQVVSRDAGVVKIVPADPQVIYVPYYEPARVVVYSPLPVYHYYPYRYPVYYYPYPVGYSFVSGYFWGVTSAFAIGWHTHHLHVHHYGYRSHPYYGRHYYDRYYYRRPLVRSHYRRPAYRDRYVRHHAGNYWQPRYRRGARPHDTRDERRHDYRDGPRRERDDYRFRTRADGSSPRLAPPDARPDGPGRNQRNASRPNRDRAVVPENRFAGSRATRFRGNEPAGNTASRISDSAAVNRGQRSTGRSANRAADQRAADEALQRRQDRAARLASRAAGLRGRSTAGTRRDAGRTAAGTIGRSQANRVPRTGVTRRAAPPTGIAAQPRSTTPSANRFTGNRGAASRSPNRVTHPEHVASSAQRSRSQASQPLALASPRSSASRAQTRPRSAAPARRAAAPRPTPSQRSVRVSPAPRAAAPAPRASRPAASSRQTASPSRAARSPSRARPSGEFTRRQARRR
jgi:hypothetical protein